MSVKARVYLVGAGPGDPDLLTIKAFNIMQKADVILYDRLVSEEILKLVSPRTKLIFVGKRNRFHYIPQEKICQLLINNARKYKTVVRLKGGDPFIFGRGGEEYSALESAGIDCEIIPGITSVSGAAASLKLPLTHRDYSSSIVFLSGHKQNDGEVCFTDFDFCNKTYVIYMGISKLAKICFELIEENKENKEIPIVVIQNATLANEKIVSGTLLNISERVLQKKISSPALIIIGTVVGAYVKEKKLNQQRLNFLNKSAFI